MDLCGPPSSSNSDSAAGPPAVACVGISGAPLSKCRTEMCMGTGDAWARPRNRQCMHCPPPCACSRRTMRAWGRWGRADFCGPPGRRAASSDIADAGGCVDAMLMCMSMRMNEHVCCRACAVPRTGTEHARYHALARSVRVIPAMRASVGTLGPRRAAAMPFIWHIEA